MCLYPEKQHLLIHCRFTTRVTATHTGTLKFNKKEYEATGKTVQVHAHPKYQLRVFRLLH